MLLTIITINYNNAAGLQKTVESVLTQTSKNFEYIIVDGAAPQPPPALRDKWQGAMSDTEVLQSFIQETKTTVNGFTNCTWKSANGEITGGFYSEKDSGIYNAMNKGIRMAKSEYIHFLNSGDWLVDENVVSNMLSTLTPSPLTPSPQGEGWGEVKTDILVGGVISIRPDGTKRYKPFNNTPVSLYTFYRGTIEHTSAYIRRELFNQYGLYDESLRIVSDWKWYLQVAGLNHARVEFANIYVSYFDTSGISSTNLQLDKQERRRVLEELIPAPILADYDQYSFDIDQMQRLKKHPWAYKMVWFVERLFFKFEKWKLKYGKWE